MHKKRNCKIEKENAAISAEYRICAEHVTMIEIDGILLCPYCFSEQEEDSLYCSECGRGGEAAKENSLPLNTLLVNRYITGDIIARNSCSILYTAYDTQKKRKIIMNEYFPESLAYRSNGSEGITEFAGGKGAVFKEGRERFHKEAKSIAELKNQDGILRILSVFYQNNTTYACMPFIEGMSLSEAIGIYGGKLPWRRAMDIAIAVLNALSAAHSLGIFHSDIRPDYVYIAASGEVKLLGFGTARRFVSEHSETLAAALNDPFSPLEAFTKSSPLDEASDIYSLGALLYYALSGIIPPAAITRLDWDKLEPLETATDPESSLMPAYFADAVSTMLSVAKEERYQSASEAMSAFKAAQAVVAPKPKPQPIQLDPPPPPVERESRVAKQPLKYTIKRDFTPAREDKPEAAAAPEASPRWSAGMQDIISEPPEGESGEEESEPESARQKAIEAVEAYRPVKEEKPKPLEPVKGRADTSELEEIDEIEPELDTGDEARKSPMRFLYLGAGIFVLLASIAIFALMMPFNVTAKPYTATIGGVTCRGEYTGVWKAFKPNGAGIFTLTENNSLYEAETSYNGSFIGGLLTGEGFIKCTDGSRYSGNFSKGLLQGKGSGFFDNGNTYFGDFLNGKFHGIGTYTYADGLTFEGDFSDGKMSGQGLFTWPNGDSFNGGVEDGKRTGYGEYKYNDGSLFKGDYKDDLMDGYGEYYGPDGKLLLKGEWSRGLFLD
ncbi:MAG: protein kinase [Eubacteriaceae bacterium]|nr:protein kinase [Eubacteriaceae bacterium]